MSSSMDLFDPMNNGLERDKSITSYEMKSFQPVNGRVLNQRSNTIKIKTNGTNQHLLPSEGYLDIVFRANAAGDISEYNIVAGVNDQFEFKSAAANPYTTITMTAGNYPNVAALETELQTRIAAAGGTGAQFNLTLVGNLIQLEIRQNNSIRSTTINSFFNYLGFSNFTLGPGFDIVTGVNDVFQVRTVALAAFVNATVAAGHYDTIALLDAAFKAAILVAIPAAAVADFTLSYDGGGGIVNLDITTNANAAIERTAANTLFAYLGWNAGAALSGIGNYPADNAFPFLSNIADIGVAVPIMHDSCLSLFRRASLWLNNVLIHSNDYPVFSTSVVKWLERSNNYITQQGPKEWFFTKTDTSEPVKQQLLGPLSNYFRRAQINLSDLFPFFKEYPHTLRGVEIRVELILNNNAREIVYFPSDAAASTINVTEAIMYIPELIGSPETEARLLDQIISKESAVIPYEDHQVYRELIPAQSNITYVLDSLSEVPLSVYVGLQLQSRLEEDQSVPLNQRNPSTYDNLKLVRAECRVNNHAYPKLPYQVSFEDPSPNSCDDYSRLFLEFYRSGQREQDYDSGGALEYTDQFKNSYPIITFNLQNEDEIQSKKGEMNTIEVFLQLSEVPAQPFFINAMVVYQNSIVLTTDGRRYEWTRQNQ